MLCNNKQWSLTAAGLAAVFSTFSTASAQAEDLLTIYSLAYQADPVLKQVVLQRDAIDEDVNQAFSRFLPSVSASANTSANNRNKPGSTDHDETYNYHGYSVDLNQSIFDNSRYVNYKIANLQISKADANLNAAQQDLIIRAANAYFNTLAAVDRVEFAKAERKAIARQLDQAKRRYEVGIIAITNVHEAQAGFDNANAQVIAAENELLIAKEVLRELTGKYIDEVSPLAEKIPLSAPAPEDISHWVEQALTGNYSLLSAKQDTQVSKENINLQRSGHYPTLGLTASYGYSKSNGPGALAGANYHSSAIGLNLSIPIYEGNAISSKTRQAHITFQQTQEAYNEVLHATEKNARSSYLNVISEISRVKALKQAVISNESALQATEAGFEVGTRTIVDVLNVQRDLFLAKQEYSNSRYIYVLNVLKLKQAAGELDRSDLEIVNKWLTATAN